VAKEINGYFLKDVTIKGKTFKKGTLVPSFAFLQADGSTSSGNWLYCNSYTEKGNMAARRGQEGRGQQHRPLPRIRLVLAGQPPHHLQPGLGGPKGIPWDRKDWVVYFKGEEKDGKYVSKKWLGDVPDGGWYPMQNPDGSWRDDAKYPFIMRKHGHAQIFGPGRADGPFPEHYEPWSARWKRTTSTRR
jgi:formate dehydrogenase major subunit